MTQLGLAGMPARLFSCTPSRLTAWLDCPRRYRMTYLDRPTPAKGAPWAHNSVGASVHAALAGWWKLPPERRTVPAAGAELDRVWVGLGFRDDAQEQGWRVRAREMVETYVAGLDPYDEPVGVERTVGLRTEKIALSGRIDRLDRRDGELVVVDYKTGRHLLSTDDARGSLALAVYALAAARTLRSRCVSVELHHLPTGDVIRWEHTDATLARHLSRVEDIAGEARDADDRYRDGLTPDQVDDVFPPRPSRMCGWCDFSAHCPEGRAAAPRLEPWSGLAEDVTPHAVDPSYPPDDR